MNGDEELLNFIYQNSQMGTDTITHLLKLNAEPTFQQQLLSQQREYSAIHQAAKDLLNQKGLDVKGLSAGEKLTTYLMINFQTLTDKSASHLAEMMMIGSNMGVIDAIKKQREYTHAAGEILALMQRLQAFEESNLTALKAYL